MNNKLKLLISLVVPLLVGYYGAVYTMPAIPTWYAGLVKPALNPPAWVFAPVWTLLYILMGIAFYLVWRTGSHSHILKNLRMKKWGMGLWVGQLVLNFLWSIIFFKYHNIAGALAEIIILWLAILVTIINFKKVSRAAVWLMLPYLLWVTFAIYLNYSIWMLN